MYFIKRIDQTFPFFFLFIKKNFIIPTIMFTGTLTLNDFKNWLSNTQRDTIIVKLGAEWCGPCKRIESLVHSCMTQIQERIPSIECAILDVDQSFEVYAFLKKKRVVNGIPALLVYNKENAHYLPDEFVMGADEPEILALFNRVIQYHNSL